MLPEGFQWTRALEHEQVPASVRLGPAEVARLMQKVDGSWHARLDCQRGMAGPLILRDCRDFESGRAGVEAWVQRHEARLRAEIQQLFAAKRW